MAHFKVCMEKEVPLSACPCQLCMADLIDSLQTSQDFLRRDSLSCACGGGDSLNRLNRESEPNRMPCPAGQ